MKKNNSATFALCPRLAWVFVTAVFGLASWIPARENLEWPPTLPDGQTVVTDTSDAFITPPPDMELRAGVTVAVTPPTIDFMYFHGQTYLGKPWSVWGDALAVGENLYYTSIGDHLRGGTSQLYEYNSETRALRLLVDIAEYLKQGDHLPEGMKYTPGKIHSRIDRGRDGWLYYSTHRGSTRGDTTDEQGYLGDWIFRTEPESAVTEIVAKYPVEKHTIPASVLDPDRMIYYGGTAAGNDAPVKGVRFLAYDVENREKLLEAPEGFPRYAIFSSTTGKVYWNNNGGKVYDPADNTIREAPQIPDVRAATRETPQGIVYAFSQRRHEDMPARGNIWAFNVNTEEVTDLGYVQAADHTYVTAMESDPSGRYVYYVAGSHGNIINEGTPVMQYDTRTGTAKVLAFVGPYYDKTYGYTPDGTFGIGLSSDGAKLYITWNGNRRGLRTGSRDWETCAMMVIHIPESERRL